jgi:glycosyltransferase involved in cell wall biosynthesis
MAGMARCLIFEAGFAGHRSEYIKHLMGFINRHSELYGKYVFALNERIGSEIKSLGKNKNFEIVYTSFSELHQHAIARSFYEWRQLSKILLGRDDINEIVFLELDPYLVLISSGRFRKFNLSVSGILFQPYIHFKASGGGVGYFLRVVLRNYLTQKLVFRLNHKIERCFILNDTAGVAFLNRRVRNIFYFLPDPIEDEVPMIGENGNSAAITKFKIEEQKKVLLLFGQIDHRKNVINIIEALRLFPDEIKRRISLVIAGKFSERVKGTYLEFIDKHKDEIDIVYNDGYVTEVEREVVFHRCDLVLMPYINFFSSSGVIGHAVRHRKSVIVSSLGLLKEVVTKYDFGVAVNPQSTKSINKGIYDMLFVGKQLKYDNLEFIREHKPGNFAKIILKT